MPAECTLKMESSAMDLLMDLLLGASTHQQNNLAHTRSSLWDFAIDAHITRTKHTCESAVICDAKAPPAHGDLSHCDFKVDAHISADETHM